MAGEVRRGAALGEGLVWKAEPTYLRSLPLGYQFTRPRPLALGISAIVAWVPQGRYSLVTQRQRGT
jgi:hypothetical protein